jgi:G3E family GTPase
MTTLPNANVTAAVEPRPAIPVTLLTGFLGAGKTTLINRLLTQAHGLRLGVIVNEFGELGIDGALIAPEAGQVIELANGCVCCATRGDLFPALDEMLSSATQLDGILIETSGLANPAPVIHDLENYRASIDIRLDSVITVIDADNFDRNLDNAEVAYEQITCGDLLLVNKIDLVTPEVKALIEQGLGRLNPAARMVFCTNCDVPLPLLLGGPTRLIMRERGEPSGPITGHEHDGHGQQHKHDDFNSAVLRLDGPLDPKRFSGWLDRLPATVFRVKGFVRFADSPEELIVHAVGSRRKIEPSTGGVHTTGALLVVICRGVLPGDLSESLRACAA